MFGALLNRVSDPFAMMNAFHLLYTLQSLYPWSVALSGFLLGWLLSWARDLAEYLPSSQRFYHSRKFRWGPL